MRTDRLHAAYLACRELQVYIHLFNVGFRYHTILWKIFSLFTCVVMTAFGIMLCHELPIIAGTNLISAITIALTYSITFEKAFKLPRGIQKYKATIGQQAKVSCDGAAATAVLSRALKSIPDSGIMSGNFIFLRRTASLDFATFVMRNVLRVLIAFQE